MSSINDHPDYQALALAVIHGKEIFNVSDIKSIRESCKLLKEAVDHEAFITKLTINIAPQQCIDLKAIAATPLLRFINHIALSYTLDDEPYDDVSRLPRYAKRILPICCLVAPQLQSLSFSTHLPPNEYSFGRRILRGDFEFPALRLLSVSPANEDTIATCRASFYSMSQLESLSLTASAGGGVTTGDLRVLAEAPFIGTLRHLNMSLYKPWWSLSSRHPVADLDIIAPLQALFRNTANLQDLVLQHSPSLLFFEGANLEHLSSLKLLDSYYDVRDYSPLRSLKELSLEDCQVQISVLNLLACDLDGGSQLPSLQDLTLKSIYRRYEASDGDEGFWDWLRRLNMPNLTSLSLRRCPCKKLSDFFKIEHAAENLPKLNSFLLSYPSNDVVAEVYSEVVLFDSFFNSPLAAQLLRFEIDGAEFLPGPLLFKNAVKMRNLTTLTAPFRTLEDFGAFIQCGQAGGWPCLANIYMTWETDSSIPSDVPSKDFQYEMVEEVWPDAHVFIY